MSAALAVALLIALDAAFAHGPIIDVQTNAADAGIQNESTITSFRQCLAAGDTAMAEVVLVGHNAPIGLDRSTDGGVTFAQHPAPPAGALSDPVLAFGATPPVPPPDPSPCGDPGDPLPPPPHVYLAYVDSDKDVAVARSDDGGQTWNAPQKFSPAGGTSTDDKPWLAVDINNDVPYVCWTDTSSAANHTVMLTGGAYTNLAISGPGSTYCQIQVDPNPPGKIYLSWYQNPGPSNVPAIMFRTCDLAAASCGATTVVDRSVIRIGTDNVNCFGRSINGDVETTESPTLTISAVASVSGPPVFVIAWNDARYGTADILARRSTNNGATWGKVPLPVNSSLAGDQFMPSIVAHRSVKLQWYDRREDAGNMNMRLWGAFSRDGGATWTNMPIGDVMFAPVVPGAGQSPSRPCYMGDYNGIGVDVVQGGPHFLHTWGDNRNGDPDVFFDLQPEPPPAPIDPNDPVGVFLIPETPSFSVAAGLPSSIPSAGATLHPADILRRNAGGTPIVGITCTNLGLTTAGCGSSAPVDDLAALSYGNDFEPAVSDPLVLAFSVAPGSMGVEASAVRIQADCAPAEPEADEFVALIDGTNLQVYDGDGAGCSFAGAPGLGLVETATPPPTSDDLDALHGRDTTTVAPAGVPLDPVYFTLKGGSPSLSTLSFTPAHILKTVNATAPTVFATPAQLGLASGDEISDICLREDGDETFDAADLLRFTLAPGSPTLSAIGATAADILRPESVSGSPQPPVVVVSAGDLGLLGSDELDALKCELPLLTDVSLAALAPISISAITGGSAAGANVSLDLGNQGPVATTGDLWLWADAPSGVSVSWVSQGGDSCIGPPVGGFSADPPVLCSSAVRGLHLQSAMAVGTTGISRTLNVTCVAEGSFPITVRTGLRATDPPGAEDGNAANDFAQLTITANCTAGDTDGDGYPDSTDGCPTTPTPFPTPFGDGDCDGFTDAEEGTIGTDPADACPDDVNDDAWPADFDKNTVVNITDLFQVLPPYFGTTVPPTSARRDLAPDAVINISDVFRVLPPFFGSSCTP